MPTLDRSQLLDCRAALLDESAGLLRLAVDAQSDVQRLQRLALAQGMQLELVELTQASLEERLAELRVQEIGQVAEDSQALYDAHGGPEREGLAQGRLLLQLLAQGLRLRASDIHLQPAADCLELRLRIDGHLRTVERLPLSLHAGLVAQVKVGARLSLAERRLPQDGRMAATLPGGRVDTRVSILPGTRGEAVLIRLPTPQAPRSIDELGMDDALRLPLLDMLRQASGLILVGGPTGSGKTTTLHALMRHLALPGRKLLSVEDPVESILPGVNQIPVEQGGMGFASTVRAMLRHAPDVIMVGEIRDPETARASTEAALTGHLVLASVHARDAAETAARLTGLGVPRHVTATVLRAALSQRLLRRLCPDCRTPCEAPDTLAAALREAGHSASGPWFEAPGCPACGQTGYCGRFGVFELLRVTPALRDSIATGGQSAGLRALSAGGRPTLAEAALAAAHRGVASLEDASILLRL